MSTPVIGIRREDINRWERRTPLTPVEVGRLVSREGVQVLVQPSDIRVFDEAEYTRAGATVAEDLSSCGTVFGIKEIPLAALAAGKTYVFFAHVIKGQPANMPMLARLRELGCAVVDYERIVDEKGRRLLFFGHFAGLAGMIDSLWALGRRLAVEGLETPFADVKPAWQYADLAEAHRAIAWVGKGIEAGGVGPGLAPLVVGFAGYGNVAKGAQEILDLLPVREVAPEDLAKLAGEKKPNDRVVYKVVFKEEHMVRAKEKGGAFQLQDYYDYPDKYDPAFEPYLPHLTVLMNCIYWDQRYPRLVTKRELRRIFGGGRRPRLRVIGDISCDVDGACEATVKYTSPEQAEYVWDVDKGEAVNGVAGNGPVILAVYNLPAELPRDASAYFGAQLLPYVGPIARANWGDHFGALDVPAPIKHATILYRGDFTPAYQYLERYLK